MLEQAIEPGHLHPSSPRPLLVFYLLAFAISWLGFLPLLAASRGIAHFQSPLWQSALLLPAVGPAVAAGIAQARFHPSPQIKDTPFVLLKRAFLKPVPLHWWAITIVLSVGMMLAASLLSSGLRHTPILSGASISSILLFSVLSVAANPFEEIGWRGLAQLRLQKLYPPLRAAIIVGTLWAVWHLPLFLLSNNPMSMAQTPFWSWAAGVIPQAILLAWLYNSTGHSLATVSLFHILTNITGDIFLANPAMVSAVRLAAALTLLLFAGPNLGAKDSSAENHALASPAPSPRPPHPSHRN